MDRSGRGWRAAAGAAALMAAGAAEAHTGAVAGAGALAGLAHPLAGPDHLLAAVLVGVWAFRTHGMRGWIVAAGFTVGTALGLSAGAAGLDVAAGEHAVALSVVVLGAMVALDVRARVPLGAAVVGLLALFHGHAHGAEAPAAMAPLAYGLGLIASTAALHAAGVAAALTARSGALRLAGATAAGTGLVLLAAA